MLSLRASVKFLAGQSKRSWLAMSYYGAMIALLAEPNMLVLLVGAVALMAGFYLLMRRPMRLVLRWLERAEGDRT